MCRSPWGVIMPVSHLSFTAGLVYKVGSCVEKGADTGHHVFSSLVLILACSRDVGK